MTKSLSEPDRPGYGVPPEIYDVAVSWDPQPEINRLLHLSRQAGARPASALELGCATGRLLEPLTAILPAVYGLELNPDMAAYARERCSAEIVVGDMTDFDLDRRFDLIFTSANTIRHAVTDAAIAGLWRCIGEHLTPGGVFIADLEFDGGAESTQVGAPATWEIARGDVVVRVSWRTVASPSPLKSCRTFEYKFESLGKNPGVWRERFELRTYDAAEFIDIAVQTANLSPAGIHENREPYLLETPLDKAVGRCLVSFQRG